MDNIEQKSVELVERQMDIISKMTEARPGSDKFHRQIEGWRKLYEFERKKSGKTNASDVPYADPVHTNTVDLAVAILLANKKNWRVQGFNPSKFEEEKSSKIEKLLAGITDMASSREEYDLDYEIVMNFVRDGAGVIYTVWDDEEASRCFKNIVMTDEKGNQLDETAYTESPLYVQIVDPTEMFLLEGGRGRWRSIFREIEMTIYDAEVRFGIEIPAGIGMTETDKKQTKGRLADYWEMVKVVPEKDETDSLLSKVKSMLSPEESKKESKFEWRAENSILFDDYFVEGPTVMPEYQDIPYTIGFYKPVDRSRPEGWGHNIMRPSESTVAMLERVISRRAFQIDAYSDLPLVATARAGREIQIDPGMGRVVKLQEGESLDYPRWPGNAPDVEEQLGYLSSKIQQSGFSEVAFGEGNSSGSGYALSQLGDQNRIRMEQPVRHLQLMWSIWAKKTLRLIEEFSPESYVRVYGDIGGSSFAEQLKGKGVSDYWVRCIIKPEFPNEKTRNHAMATQVMKVLSKRTIGEQYLGIEQMDDEMDRMLEEQMAQNPILQQYAIMKQLEQSASEGDKAAALMLDDIRKNGMPKGGGASQEGGDPEMQQFRGMESATGQPTPQAQGQPPPGQGDLNKQQSAANESPRMVPS